jgi:nitrous oxidase accessory protein NosD
LSARYPRRQVVRGLGGAALAVPAAFVAYRSGLGAGLRSRGLGPEGADTTTHVIEPSGYGAGLAGVPQQSGGVAGSIQAAVDAAAPGATVTIPPGLYRETVTIGKPLTLVGEPGAVIDGRDEAGHVVRERWVRIASNDVTVRGFEMQYASNPSQQGAISNDGFSNITFDSLNLHHAGGAALSIRSNGVAFSAHNVRAVNCDIHENGQLGVHGWGSIDSLIENCRIYANHTLGLDLAWEAGGIKVAETARLMIRGCDVYANDGAGIWFDVMCSDCVVDWSRIHGNTSTGVHYEVSGGGRIAFNQLWANGFSSPGWGQGAAVRLANSRDCVIEGNIAAWNADGLCVTMQDRTDWPGHQEVVNNVLRDNVVAIANPHGEHNVLGIAFVWDTDNGTRSWSHTGNALFHAHSGSPWSCGGPEGWGPNDAGWFQYFDANGLWLSQEELVSRLSAAGLPTTP